MGVAKCLLPQPPLPPLARPEFPVVFTSTFPAGAAVGVWLHGRAGDLAAERLTPYGMTPEDVVSSLPAAIGEIL